MAKGPRANHLRGESLRTESDLIAEFLNADFLNVDLDVRSRRSLAALLDAWPWAQTPGRTAGEAPRWIHLSSLSRKNTANGILRDLIESVDSLPPKARRCWADASSRVFDIGIRAGWAPRNWFQVPVRADVLRAIVRLRASVLVTVYPPSRE